MAKTEEEKRTNNIDRSPSSPTKFHDIVPRGKRNMSDKEKEKRRKKKEEEEERERERAGSGCGNRGRKMDWKGAKRSRQSGMVARRSQRGKSKQQELDLEGRKVRGRVMLKIEDGEGKLELGSGGTMLSLAVD
ncbi:hypothetical protein ACLOJK_017496 [Asimina triloba]